MQSPETHLSLIARLQDLGDADAWHQFSELYRPIVVRMGLAKGLQNADAEDLAQRVLVSVSGAIARWDPSGKARFRTWLKRVTDNAILNAISRARPDQGRGNHEDQSLLLQQPDRSGPDSRLLQMEFRRQVMHWAAQRIRDEFTETTWQAFWMTAVEGRAADDVGAQLGRNRGSIYAARSRVMRRLVEQASEFDEWESNE